MPPSRYTCFSISNEISIPKPFIAKHHISTVDGVRDVTSVLIIASDTFMSLDFPADIVLNLKFEIRMYDMMLHGKRQ